MITIDVPYFLGACITLVLAASVIANVWDISHKPQISAACLFLLLGLMSAYACGRYAGNAYPDKPAKIEARCK